MKLHIGCGEKNLPGWKHMDVRKVDEHIDYVGEAGDLSQFESGSIDEIYACHLLEHIGRHEVVTVLKEWNRVLCVGGWLHVAVPNFESICEYYMSTHDLNKIMGLLYGGQDYQYNFHFGTFDFVYMANKLTEAGFHNIKMYDWREFLPEGYDDYSRAYLPHMDLEKGKLMSLNVMAVK